MAGRSVSLTRILDLVARVGQERDLAGMLSRALEELSELVPCDQLLTIISNPRPMNVAETLFTVSVGVPEVVKRAYLDYYGTKDIIYVRLRDNPQSLLPCFFVDWRDPELQQYEFTTDFVRRIGRIDVCAGFPFMAPAIGPVGVLEVTRSGCAGFSDRDARIIRLVQPHIANYFAIFRRLGALPPPAYTAAELRGDSRLLTSREAHVASLLRLRLRPREIATMLLISPRTVERHIENIYDKLGVNSRREMLRRLFWPPCDGG